MLPQSTLRRYTVDEESASLVKSAAATADDATAFAIYAAPSVGDDIPPASIGDAIPTTTAAATFTNQAIPAAISAAPSTTEITPTTTDAAPTPDEAAPTTNDTTPLAANAPPPALTLYTPAQITALALVPHDICADTLVAGSADGTLRVYDLTHGKVLRAVRGLGDEVASIAIVLPDKKGKGADKDKAKGTDKDSSLRSWVACGRKVLHFDLSPTAPMLQTAEDATAAVDVCEEDGEDAVNGLTLLPRGTHLAFCTDAGAVGVLGVEKVGVLDIDTGKIRRLRGRHSNLASTLHPVPHRPRELVSGGYDCQVVLHDWEAGGVLGRGEVGGAAPPSEDTSGGISPSSTSNGISLSPPFVLASAMSSAGVLAAGLADGRVWVGAGGERVVETTPTSKKPKDKKRTKKWEGLDAKGALAAKVAEGPVVGVAWKDQNTFLACSLLGQLIEVTLDRVADSTTKKGDERALRHRVLRQVGCVSKVNALAVGERYVVVGGVGKDGRGTVEVVREVG